jgi:hypothetical protein
MRAISLWEPYATAMRYCVKQNETRSWPTSYRGDLLICASKKKLTKDDLETAEILLYELPGNYVWPLGCAICVVELMDCIRSDCFGPAGLPLPSREAALGNYSIGRWVWRTKNLRILKEPIPIIGRQGLWIPDPEIVNKCMSVLA